VREKQDLRSTAPRCMSARPFLDTNVLVYALVHDAPKTPSAEALLSAGGVISVHVVVSTRLPSLKRRRWRKVAAMADSQ
jgi:predicted nucleic acid-binding protein